MLVIEGGHFETASSYRRAIHFPRRPREPKTPTPSVSVGPLQLGLPFLLHATVSLTAQHSTSPYFPSPLLDPALRRPFRRCPPPPLTYRPYSSSSPARGKPYKHIWTTSCTRLPPTCSPSPPACRISLCPVCLPASSANEVALPRSDPNYFDNGGL